MDVRELFGFYWQYLLKKILLICLNQAQVQDCRHFVFDYETLSALMNLARIPSKNLKSSDFVCACSLICWCCTTQIDNKTNAYSIIVHTWLQSTWHRTSRRFRWLVFVTSFLIKTIHFSGSTGQRHTSHSRHSQAAAHRDTQKKSKRKTNNRMVFNILHRYM